ncbi:vacuolar protein sorting-associated protein 33B-like [Ylistrum balloti]|uniref:vacuolar protein sorting-associated protein 33B-like n=1 Tax=Ylistrum balloti TaxID=509963 RepID=UPI002905C723|nr:vacuolar protein sorting-associated protein 33B-like [Ylistrum balloti]
MSAPSTTFPNVQKIRDVVRNELATLLLSFKGKKDLVLESDLMKPLDRIAGASLLKQHGVDKIFKLDPSQKSIQGCDQRIYLVRPRMRTMKVIADHISGEKNYGTSRKYKIIMVPRKLHVCEMILEHEGVFGDVTLDELPLDLIPLDRDILSLELSEFFKTFYLENDHLWLHTVSKSLIGLQALIGMIPNVYCIGRGSKMVYELMNSILGEKLAGTDYSRNEIGNLILIDRDVDYVTPLCSQLTYEGLLDEAFGINSGYVEFGSDVTGKEQPVKLMLSSEDEIFEEVRNRHFSNVFSFLSNKAKSLQTDFDKRHTLKSVGDMKNYVANELKNLKNQKAVLAHHIGACEVILGKKTRGDFQEILQAEHAMLEGSGLKENISYIEELINKQHNITQTLRLLCLLSMTQDGITSKEFKSLKTQFLHSYGYEHMLTCHNLKRLGILTDQEAQAMPLTAGVQAAMGKRGSYRSLCKRLALIPKTDEINLKSPTDMSYVFSGAYTPISCKLVEQVLSKEGFTGMEEILKNLPGGTFSDVKIKQKGKGSSTNATSPSQRVVLVYFLGGCTYSEITALRFLGRLKGYRFLVATTAMINGNTWLNSLVEK